MTYNKKNLLKDKDWKFCVKNFPIVSIDLILRNQQSELLMGKRINNPAKGFYFVPGGRIFKDENIENAIERISLNELGHKYKKEETRFINFYEHLYENSFWNNEDITTHYIVMAFLIHTKKNDLFNLNNQHEDLKWIAKEDSKKLKVHKYSLFYFDC